MSNKFLKHFTIIGIGTALNLLLGVITTPLITRIVDPTEYGRLSIFTMYSNIAVMILCLGLDQAFIRYYYDAGNIEYRRSLLFKCVKFPVIVSTIGSLIIIMLLYSGLINFEFTSTIMILLCLYTIVQIIYRFSLLVIRLEFNSKLYSTLGIILKAIYVCVAVPLVLLFKQNYILLLVTGTFTAAVICLFVSIISQRKMWNPFLNNKSSCTVETRELMKYAYPFIISMGVTTLFQAIDKLSLNHYLSYADVGIYSSTMSLVHIFAIIQTTFNTLWAPMTVEHYSKNPEDKTFYQKGNQLITVFMFFIGISLILVKDIFAILLGSKYREAAYILPFLIFNPIMYTVSETTVVGLVLKKKSNMQVVVAASACITNFIGNTILVPQLGCRGAAISTGLSYILFFTLRTALSNKYFYVDFKLKKFYVITALTCIYAFYNTFFEFSFISIIGYLVIIIFVYFMYRATIKWGFTYTIAEVNKLIKKNRGSCKKL